jgi:hypothetical protein
VKNAHELLRWKNEGVAVGEEDPPGLILLNAGEVFHLCSEGIEGLCSELLAPVASAKRACIMGAAQCCLED